LAVLIESFPVIRVGKVVQTAGLAPRDREAIGTGVAGICRKALQRWSAEVYSSKFSLKKVTIEALI
jgi:hypothetical protein